MKKRTWVFAALLCLVLFGTYSYFVGKEYEIRISEDQIREKLNAKMPIRKDYLLILEVVLDNPRVALEDGTNRVAGGLDLVLNIGLKSEKLPLGGAIDISGQVRYEPDAGQFFLADPVIEKFAVQGIPERYTEKVNQVLTKALDEYYSSHPIYTLNALDLKQGAARLLLKHVVVESKHLIITLGI